MECNENHLNKVFFEYNKISSEIIKIFGKNVSLIILKYYYFQISNEIKIKKESGEDKEEIILLPLSNVKFHQTRICYKHHSNIIITNRILFGKFKVENNSIIISGNLFHTECNYYPLSTIDKKYVDYKVNQEFLEIKFNKEDLLSNYTIT